MSPLAHHNQDSTHLSADVLTAGFRAGRFTENFAIQISAARRAEPETVEEGDQTRQTASVEFSRDTAGGFLAASLILGRNKLEEGIEWGNTLEATWKFRGANFVYGRVESADRDILELETKRQRPVGVVPRRTSVQAWTAGYVRNVPLLREVETGLEAAFTLYRFDAALEPAYGDRPVSFQGFLRLRFGRHGAGAEHQHHG